MNEQEVREQVREKAAREIFKPMEKKVGTLVHHRL